MYRFYYARFMHIIFNLPLVQLVKYRVHKTRKMKSIRANSYHISLLYTKL